MGMQIPSPRRVTSPAVRFCQPRSRTLAALLSRARVRWLDRPRAVAVPRVAYKAADSDVLSLANDSSPGSLSENRGRLPKIDIISPRWEEHRAKVAHCSLLERR